MAVAFQTMRISFVHRSAPCFTISSFAQWQTASRPYGCQRQARNVSHTATATATKGSEMPASSDFARMSRRLPPLSILPLPKLIRSYLISAVSSSPLLLHAALGTLKLLAHSRSPILNPDRNPILHLLLKRTVYAQFCAGETADEVRQTTNMLKRMGHKGVILAYAREVCIGSPQAKHMRSNAREENLDANEISGWAKGTLATVSMAQPGDFVALKFTGAGTQAVQHLAQGKAPSPLLEKSITEACGLARSREVRLLFDAEQDAVQAGIEAWTIHYMRRYNRSGRALVYGTYQAYKKTTPGTLARHLELAREEGFALGVKLVRGAYLGCDPRHLFWDTIEETHKTYDGIAEALIRRAFNETLRPITASTEAFPSLSVVLASHNSDSVAKAQKIRNSQVSSGEPRIDLSYGQLMGMAENISCDLVLSGQPNMQENGNSIFDVPRAYQYLAWGTVGECSQYLVRRAEENKDALSRTKEGRQALGKELLRRLGLSAR